MKDKYIGMCKVGTKGQIVIPKEARDMFNIKPEDNVMLVCDKNKGIAIVKSDVVEDLTNKIMPTVSSVVQQNYDDQIRLFR